MTEPPDRELDVFSAARQLPAGQRAAYLDKACAGDATFRQRIEELLKFGDSPPTVATGPGGTMRLAAVATEKAGDLIGRYKLLQQIGEGGCGIVYMAEQEVPVRRRVALKVIKLGMDTKEVVARFEAERQALALMDHPNIAKVFDAGATDKGRPYFVMELVRGIKITEYCDQNNLSTRQRLDLFIQICHAIQHAHQKGIIHRDIKPSNILVTMHDGVPVPKVIDFGIAKATHGKLTDQTLFTAFEQFIGTPAYMSPEQAEMSALDIDTRSDIYSLGVLLYELLTGQTPFDAKELLQGGLDAIRKTIREQEPARPSTRLSTMLGADLTLIAKQRKVEAPGLVNLVRGDLDWIVMKALEKDRTRRYETANGLAADIQRHLNNDLVLARPPSNLYRLQKLARRNKLAFAAGSAIVAALAVGVAVSVWGLVKEHRALLVADQERKQAEANEQKAEAEAAKSRQVAQFLKDMLNGVGPSVALGRDTTLLREILDNTAKRVGTDMAKQPDVEAELRYTLGEVYWELGDLEDAEAMHRSALNIRLRELGTNNAAVAESMRHLGHVLWRRGRLDEAEKLARDGVAMQRKLFGDTNLDLAGSLDDLAAVLCTKQNTREGEKVLREALAIREALLGHDNLAVADTMEDLAAVLPYRGKKTEGDALSHDALAIREKLLGADNPLVIIASLKIQAAELEIHDKLSEAETALNDLVAANRKIYGNEHPSLAQALNRLASLLKKEGKLSESETTRREALAMQRKCLGDDSEEVASTLVNLGVVLSNENKLSEAENMFRESVTIRKELFGNDNINVSYSLSDLVGVLEKEGKLEEAMSVNVEEANGTNSVAASAQYRLAVMYRLGKGVPKDMAEAAKRFRKAADLGNSPAQCTLGSLYSAGIGVPKNEVEAAKWYHKAANQGHALAQTDLAEMYQDGRGVPKDLAEAEKWYRKAAGQGYGLAMQHLIDFYFSTGRNKEATDYQAKLCATRPTDTIAALDLATWQAWFGQDAAYDTTRTHFAQQEEGTTDAGGAEQSAKACCLRPSSNTVLLAKVLTLAQRCLELDNQPSQYTPWHLLALGLAQYRNGQYAAAEQTLIIVEKTAVLERQASQGVARLFRAMSLFQQKRPEEAGKLFRQAETEMPPFPQDESKPFLDGKLAYHDALICWLAYKEAKAMLLAGNSDDTKKAAAAYAQQIKDQASLKVLWQEARTAYSKKKWDEALAKLDEVEKLTPKDKGLDVDLAQARFPLLIAKKDYNAAYKIAEQFSDAYPDDAQMQNDLAWHMVTDTPIEQRDLALAEKIATRALKASQSKDDGILDTLACIFFMEGKQDQAVTMEEQALNLAKGGRIQSFQKTLESYKKGSNKPDVLSRQAEQFRNDGNKAGQETTLREELAVEENLWATNSARWEDTLRRLADLLVTEHKTDEAEKVYAAILTPEFVKQKENASLLTGRGYFFGRHGRWKEAAADYAQVIALTPDNYINYHWLAPLLVQCGDQAGYQNLCAQILARFGNTSDSTTAMRITIDCLFTTNSGADLDAVAKLADLAAAKNKNDLWNQLAKGLAEYRQGRFAAAEEPLQIALDGQNPYTSSGAALVLGMAQYQLKQPDQSRTSLDKGYKLIDAKLPKPGKDGIGGDGWNDWLYNDALLHEVAALTGSPARPASQADVKP